MATGDNFVVGLPNSASSLTELTATPAPRLQGGLKVTTTKGNAIVGDTTVGTSTMVGAAVIGTGPETGVFGAATAGSGVGVTGEGQLAGIVGTSTTVRLPFTRSGYRAPKAWLQSRT